MEVTKEFGEKILVDANNILKRLDHRPFLEQTQDEGSNLKVSEATKETAKKNLQTFLTLI